jgi:hypothetical protein
MLHGEVFHAARKMLREGCHRPVAGSRKSRSNLVEI